MAETTSTTASTSLARDFLLECFVRDLVLIPVLRRTLTEFRKIASAKKARQELIKVLEIGGSISNEMKTQRLTKTCLVNLWS
jgi:hypothetical protein